MTIVTTAYAVDPSVTRRQKIESRIASRAALLAAFSDRLLDALLVGIGEPKHTRAEKDAASRGWSYQPAGATGQ
jgi:hypothetical protein